MSGTSQTSIEMQTDVGLPYNKSRRKMRGCKCRGNCLRRCGCYAKDYICSDNCNCSSACQNRSDLNLVLETGMKSSESSYSEEDNKENKDSTFVKHETEDVDNSNAADRLSSLLTPQAMRRSAIHFDTNSAKKKFFQ